MAVSESIKRRMSLLQDECALAENLARCLVQSTTEDMPPLHPLVYQFENTVDRLNSRVEGLIRALNRGGARHGKKRR